jgi:hypothetical protein
LIPLDLQFVWLPRKRRKVWNLLKFNRFAKYPSERFAMFLSFIFLRFLRKQTKGLKWFYFIILFLYISFGLLFEAVMEEMNRKISNHIGDSDSAGKGTLCFEL